MVKKAAWEKGAKGERVKILATLSTIDTIYRCGPGFSLVVVVVVVVVVENGGGYASKMSPWSLVKLKLIIFPSIPVYHQILLMHHPGDQFPLLVLASSSSPSPFSSCSFPSSSSSSSFSSPSSFSTPSHASTSPEESREKRPNSK